MTDSAFLRWRFVHSISSNTTISVRPVPGETQRIGDTDDVIHFTKFGERLPREEGLETFTDGILNILDLLRARGLRRKDPIPEAGWTFNGDAKIRLEFQAAPFAPPIVTWAFLIKILDALEFFFENRKGTQIYETNYDVDLYSPSGRRICTIGRGQVTLQRQVSS